MNTLDAVNRGWWPDGMKLQDSGDEPDRFDEFDHEHLAALHAHLMQLMDEKAPGFMDRIIGGMCAVILNPENKLIDLTSDTLELHPDLKAAIAAYTQAQAEEAPAAPPEPTLDDSELEDLAHAANQEALSYGISLDPFLRLPCAAAALPPPQAQAEDAREPLTDEPKLCGRWLCLLCKSSRPNFHGMLDDKTTPCPYGINSKAKGAQA